MVVAMSMRDHLSDLEKESIYVLRETARQFKKPVLLFSGGKDSLLLMHLSVKAFRPGKGGGRFPYPILHIDTGHNFPEALEFRDRLMADLGENLIVRKVEDSIRAGRAVDETGPFPSRNRQQSVTLMDAMAEFGFDAAIGGARRDEEKSRAKERFFSLRNSAGAWDPKNQRPELWRILNGRMRSGAGEQMRVFPLNNWTENDVWHGLSRMKVEVPSLYFAHTRRCVRRPDGNWLAMSPYVFPTPDCVIEERMVRFRTVGDMTCTAPVFSSAKTIEECLVENAQLPTSERGTRVDDQTSDAAMEDRKKEGYF
ncbi:MAG: sulfate adenylyltransferase subunit 2 [Bdellovibrionales bacterium]|nr:sulfate adenylyltransferase subunit 2 [Bdellovibrionales bacterium]